MKKERKARRGNGKDVEGNERKRKEAKERMALSRTERGGKIEETKDGSGGERGGPEFSLVSRGRTRALVPLGT